MGKKWITQWDICSTSLIILPKETEVPRKGHVSFCKSLDFLKFSKLKTGSAVHSSLVWRRHNSASTQMHSLPSKITVWESLRPSFTVTLDTWWVVYLGRKSTLHICCDTGTPCSGDSDSPLTSGLEFKWNKHCPWI